MRILLIDGNGFIGAPLGRELHRRGHQVAVLHRRANPVSTDSEEVEIQGDRNRLSEYLVPLHRFSPDVIIDPILSSQAQVEQLMRVARELTPRVGQYKIQKTKADSCRDLQLDRMTSLARFAFSSRRHILAYWVTTTLVVFELAVGGVWDILRVPQVRSLIERLGYPQYFLMILGIWKLLGAVALVIPGFPRLKEWAYAGVIFDLTGAIASQLASGLIDARDDSSRDHRVPAQAPVRE